MAETKVKPTQSTAQLVTDILATIDREREREIIARRFGLFDRKETLEQIGEMLGITRERVRQLEKTVVSRLISASEQGALPHVVDLQMTLSTLLSNMGHLARVSELSSKLSNSLNREEQARVAFIAQLCPDLVVVQENDDFFYSVGIKKVWSDKAIKTETTKLITAVKKFGEPKTVEEIAKAISITDTKQAAALASITKALATLNNRWGLIKWPMVNPKNIRDKIYVILKENGKQLHFNEIATSIKDSSFKRKDVTTQAIHNELIKDKRFVLIGRGIYALKEWGYEKGTVSDVISNILREANQPLHRDEIVKRVLKSRFVKETTILLNLQGKPQFKRVAKATYALAEAE